MASTFEQKETFRRSFALLLKKAPVETQKLWNGEITWEDNTSEGAPSKAILEHVTGQFEAPLKARYTDMLNQLRRKAG
jgi:hypothetical protein